MGARTVICTRYAHAGELIGGMCPECSHALVMHGASANQALDHCLICELVQTLADFNP